jgi:hypothetical protein
MGLGVDASVKPCIVNISFLYILDVPGQTGCDSLDQLQLHRGQQPLGAKLFRRVCVRHKKEYYHYNKFLDTVDGYEVEQEDVRVKSAQAIVTKYLMRPATSDSGVDTCKESQG